MLAVALQDRRRVLGFSAAVEAVEDHNGDGKVGLLPTEEEGEEDSGSCWGHRHDWAGDQEDGDYTAVLPVHSRTSRVFRGNSHHSADVEAVAAAVDGTGEDPRRAGDVRRNSGRVNSIAADDVHTSLEGGRPVERSQFDSCFMYVW